MKKTVVFEFPDDFKFPEYFGQRVGQDSAVHPWIRARSMCERCPFDSSVDDEPMCFLTGDCEYGPSEFDRAVGEMVYLPHPQCPFYNGADTVNYNDC